VLDATLADQLRSHFSRISRPVELVASLDDGDESARLSRFLDDVAGLSDAISVVRGDGDARRPSFAVSSEATGDRVRFAGVPGGHELSSLVLAVLHVGGHPSTVPADLLERARRLDGDLAFETFFSVTCQNCPDVVQALNLLSVVNPNVRHVAVDGTTFRQEAEARDVMAVPSVFLNGEPFLQGRATLDDIVTALEDRQGGDDRPAAHPKDAASNDPASKDPAPRDPFDVLVVGGGPAGASAAVYAARKGIRTGVVAERFGGQVLDTVAIENFISVPATEGPKLAAALEGHVRGHDVDLIGADRAVRLLPRSPADGLVGVELASGTTLRATTVVLSTGARWRRLGVPGEDRLRNRGVTFCPHCDGPLFAGKRVAVVGGGNSGVEAAIDLAGLAAHVTLVEFDGSLRADAVLQRKLHSLPNADVVLNAATTEVLGDTRVTGLAYDDRGTGEPHRLDVDGVFVQIGLVPNSEWLEGAVELTARGEVVVDHRGATSVPGVFAAGDCTTVPFKQIVIAVGAGSTAALSAFDYLIRSTAPEAVPAGVAGAVPAGVAEAVAG